MRKGEQGSSSAWTAVFLGLVFMPLLMLVGDGARLYYVRGRLTTAAEAACADAAWVGADRAIWQVSAEDTFRGPGSAYDTFYAMLSERSRVRYTPSISIVLDAVNNRAICDAQAEVPLVVLGNVSPRPVTVRVRAVSQMRFTNPVLP